MKRSENQRGPTRTGSFFPGRLVPLFFALFLTALLFVVAADSVTALLNVETPISDAEASRRLDEAAERTADAFFIEPGSIRVVNAGPAPTVELTLRWKPSVTTADGRQVEIELLRLTADYESTFFLDSRRTRWRPISGGETNVALTPGETSKRLRVKLKPFDSAPLRGKGADTANSADTADTAEKEIERPTFVSGEIHLCALWGLAPVDFVFPDVFAPSLNDEGGYRARRTLDAASVRVERAERRADDARLTLGVDYAEPFDFFDSHEERLPNRSIGLKRVDSSQIADADSPSERVRGAVFHRPRALRPIRTCEKGATFEAIFALPAASSAGAWDLSIYLPVRLIETRAAVTVPGPSEP